VENSWTKGERSEEITVQVDSLRRYREVIHVKKIPKRRGENILCDERERIDGVAKSTLGVR